MKKNVFVLFLVLVFVIAFNAFSFEHICKQTTCNSEQVTESDSSTILFNERIKSDTIVGDFNGDGLIEKVWFATPHVLDWDMQKCDGPIVTTIHCSNVKVNKLKYKKVIGGRLQNLGDLNDDKCDELGYYDRWFLSNWHSYHILGLKKGKVWKELVNPILMWDVWDNEVAKPEFVPIKKLDKHHVMIYEYNLETGKFDTKVISLN